MDEERFLGGWTRSKLAARTPEERYDIWKRAKGLHTADGNQLAREIRLRYQDLPIVLTTGYVESVADMREGEFKLLMKPYTLEGLAEALGVAVK